MYSDLIGIPFIDGGRNKSIGYDCWGLAMEIYRRYGIPLPNFDICCNDCSGIDNLVDMASLNPFWVELNTLTVPCIISMRFNSPVYTNHVGVYIGDNKFIHTAKKTGVKIERLDHSYWRHRITGYYIPKCQEKGVAK